MWNSRLIAEVGTGGMAMDSILGLASGTGEIAGSDVKAVGLIGCGLRNGIGSGGSERVKERDDHAGSDEMEKGIAGGRAGRFRWREGRAKMPETGFGRRVECGMEVGEYFGWGNAAGRLGREGERSGVGLREDGSFDSELRGRR